jgi:hypothetical protein
MAASQQGRDMSLESAGEKARATLDRTVGPTSKVDLLLEKLPEADAERLRSWLNDPKGWSSHMIAKALGSYSATEGKDFTLGHSTIDRWRILNGVKT